MSHLVAKLTFTAALIGCMLSCPISCMAQGGSATGQSKLASKSVEIPSCYEIQKIPGGKPEVSRTVVILLDETTVLPNSIRDTVLRSLKAFVQPGTHLTIMRFSAFTKDRSARIMMRGDIEPRIAVPDPDKSTLTIRATKVALAQANSLNACIDGQHKYVTNLAQQAVNTVFNEATSQILQSEIFGALHSASTLLNNPPAHEKILFVVSDMLENSSFTSFYSKNDVKLLDPKTELLKIEKEGFIEDFHGAKVYVVGAGLFPAPQLPAGEIGGGKLKAKATPAYRNARVMQSHKRFWEAYFTRSKATVVEFGQPDLLGQVKLGQVK